MKLDSMIVDKLQMKMWMLRTGKWKDERHSTQQKTAVKKRAFLLPAFK
jgi:hypothetical protein